MLITLFGHITRVVTFRHPGTGLPSRLGTVCAVYAVGLLIALTRWYPDSGFSIIWGYTAAVALAASLGGYRLAAGYMLVSCGVDLTAASLYWALGAPVRYPLYGLWEVAAFVVLFVRMPTEKP